MSLVIFIYSCFGRPLISTFLFVCAVQVRAKKSLWPQIEETLKQVDTASKELECFEALKRQEQSASTHRVNNLWEEVQKQKELERTLQKRYGDLLSELEATRQLMDEKRELEEAHKRQVEETEAKSRELELAEPTANQIPSDDPGSSKIVDPMHEDDSAVGPGGDATATEKEEAKPGTNGDVLLPVETDGSVSVLDSSENATMVEAAQDSAEAKENQPNVSKQETSAQEMSVDSEEVSGGNGDV